MIPEAFFACDAAEGAFFVRIHMSSSHETGRETKVKREREITEVRKERNGDRVSIGEHSESRGESEDWRTGGPSRPTQLPRKTSPGER